MKRTTIPDTDSIRELAEFWDTHDVTDFEDRLEEVREPVFRRWRGQSFIIAFGLVSVPVEAASFRDTRRGDWIDVEADLEVECFVPADTLPPPKFSSCVCLGAALGGDKAYQLLLEAMKAEGLRAVGRARWGGRERIFLIRLIENTMILERLETLEALTVQRDRPATKLARGDVNLARELVRVSSVERYDLYEDVNTAERNILTKGEGAEIVRLDEWIAKRATRPPKRTLRKNALEKSGTTRRKGPLTG